MSRFPLALALIAASALPAFASSKSPTKRQETKLALATQGEVSGTVEVASAPAVTVLPPRTARAVRVVLPSPYGR